MRIQNIILVPALIVLSLMLPLPLGAQKPSAPDKSFIVILDPGHGGHDSGVKGQAGTLEKDVALTLARLVQRRLSPIAQVVLTRSGDYDVELDARASAANHAGGSLFVSLHAAGSFLHAAQGGTIFYYETPAEKTLFTESADAALSATDDCTLDWNCIQQNHALASRVLAETVQKALAARIPFWTFTRAGAPLRLLKGLDMPAIMVESGYLSNPADEKTLGDPQALAAVSTALAEAIQEFFKRDF